MEKQVDPLSQLAIDEIKIKKLQLFSEPIRNQAHNILRLFDGWKNFSFTTSETKRDYQK